MAGRALRSRDERLVSTRSPGCPDPPIWQGPTGLACGLADIDPSERSLGADVQNLRGDSAPLIFQTVMLSMRGLHT
jgi:hypothetical protein